LSSTEALYADEQAKNAQLQAENDVLKCQIDMLALWSERWQAIQEGDIAIQEARKIAANQPNRAEDQSW
jgi:hypothetical protein